jgi:cytochrome c-type biogenesis protein CcsB
MSIPETVSRSAEISVSSPSIGVGSHPRSIGKPCRWKKAKAVGYLYAGVLAIGALYALNRFSSHMDLYEQAILLLTVPMLIWLGLQWNPLRLLSVSVAALALLAVALYSGDVQMAEQSFFLKYLLSSQSAILWMGTLFFLSTLTYWFGFAARSHFSSRFASRLCWSAVVLGTAGMLVRWYESYLMGTDIGHIPVSNLYEVFVLFALITALFYLFYEEKYKTLQLGPFVMLIISAAVAFLLWYSASRGAGEIQPLVPALQSWWMKIHVPTNFVGYGTFALAAMVGVAYLLKSYNIFSDRLPSLELLDDVMYKAIAVGFAFFTIATILGALWAAEAWGGYWSWDPKETWALIVWLNYATWLHMRLVKNMRGRTVAWWAIAGLLVTTFAFIGVNMFLSGLHSYGEL